MYALFLALPGFPLPPACRGLSYCLLLPHDALPHSAQAGAAEPSAHMLTSSPTSALQLVLLRDFVTMAKLRNTNRTFVIYLFSVFIYVYACVCTCMPAYVCNMCRSGAPSSTVSVASLSQTPGPPALDCWCMAINLRPHVGRGAAYPEHHLSRPWCLD